jgi:DNA-binding transcriptional regulator YhcF (GntR family)
MGNPDLLIHRPEISQQPERRLITKKVSKLIHTDGVLLTMIDLYFYGNPLSNMALKNRYLEMQGLSSRSTGIEKVPDEQVSVNFDKGWVMDDKTPYLWTKILEEEGILKKVPSSNSLQLIFDFDNQVNRKLAIKAIELVKEFTQPDCPFSLSGIFGPNVYEIISAYLKVRSENPSEKGVESSALTKEIGKKKEELHYARKVLSEKGVLRLLPGTTTNIMEEKTEKFFQKVIPMINNLIDIDTQQKPLRLHEREVQLYKEEWKSITENHQKMKFYFVKSYRDNGRSKSKKNVTEIRNQFVLDAFRTVANLYEPLSTNHIAKRTITPLSTTIKTLYELESEGMIESIKMEGKIFWGLSKKELENAKRIIKQELLRTLKVFLQLTPQQAWNELTPEQKKAAELYQLAHQAYLDFFTFPYMVDENYKQTVIDQLHEASLLVASLNPEAMVIPFENKPVIPEEDPSERKSRHTRRHK